MPDEIKKCPFCGGDAEADLNRFFVTYDHENGSAVAIYCTACSVEVSLCKGDLPHMTTDELYTECLKIWNRRSSISMETAQKLADALSKAWECADNGTYPIQVKFILDNTKEKVDAALARFNAEKGWQG